MLEPSLVNRTEPSVTLTTVARESVTSTAKLVPTTAIFADGVSISKDESAKDCGLTSF
jgi:hypothetical protein